jgi:hypothetical protein
LSLSIQKSTAKNHIATYLEIGSQHYSAANLEISSKTISLPIHKSVAKTFSLPISKSAAMMESFQLYFSFFFVFFGVYNNSAHSSILFSHNSSLIHAKSIHYHEHEFLPQLMHVSMS